MCLCVWNSEQKMCQASETFFVLNIRLEAKNVSNASLMWLLISEYWIQSPGNIFNGLLWKSKSLVFVEIKCRHMLQWAWLWLKVKTLNIEMSKWKLIVNTFPLNYASTNDHFSFISFDFHFENSMLSYQLQYICLYWFASEDISMHISQ